jgi:hypothetical protein
MQHNTAVIKRKLKNEFFMILELMMLVTALGNMLLKIQNMQDVCREDGNFLPGAYRIIPGMSSMI